MKVSITRPDGSTAEANLRLYAFPKKGNAPEGYAIEGAEKAATTGGGKYPAYTYVVIEGVSRYFPKEFGALPSGTKMKVVAEAPKATEAPKAAKPAKAAK